MSNLSTEQFANSRAHNDQFAEGKLHKHVDTISVETVKRLVLEAYIKTIRDTYHIERMTMTPDGKDFLLEFRADNGVQTANRTLIA